MSENFSKKVMKSPSNKKYRVCFIFGKLSQKCFRWGIKRIAMNNDIVLSACCNNIEQIALCE
jgi:hypothetical protein